MRKIKSTDTKPEILLRKELKKLGHKFSIHCDDIPGKPDIVFVKERITIFIDGDFWHGYKWAEKRKRIKSNRDYWIKKIERNIKRDKKNNTLLRKKGWMVLRFWEYQIKKDINVCINKITKHLK